MVFDSRDEDFFTFLKKILLNSANMLDVADVLIEARVDSHVLGAHREALPVLVLVFYVQNEGDARRVLAHHFFQEAHREVDALDHQRLIALVEAVDHLSELFCHKRALLLVALQSDPIF